MKRRFIILVDFSPYSENLIRYACDWSRQANAELLLVHQTLVVAPGFIEGEDKQKLVRWANEEAMEKLKTLAQELIPSSVKTSFLVSESHLQLTLSGLLAEPYENLIFVGLKGTGLLKKIFLGSVALDVIDHVNNIVVAIPKEIDSFSHQKIFVAAKKEQPLNIVELNRFLSFINKKSASITFFHLARPSEDTKGLEKHLKDLAAVFSDRFNTGIEIYEGRNAFSDIEKVINNKVDEILIVQRGSRLLTDLFFRRFLINRLVYKGQTPLIVLP